MSIIDAKSADARRREPGMLELMTDFFRDVARALWGNDPSKAYMKRQRKEESTTH